MSVRCDSAAGTAHTKGYGDGYRTRGDTDAGRRQRRAHLDNVRALMKKDDHVRYATRTGQVYDALNARFGGVRDGETYPMCAKTAVATPVRYARNECQKQTAGILRRLARNQRLQGNREAAEQIGALAKEFAKLADEHDEILQRRGTATAVGVLTAKVWRAGPIECGVAR